MFEGGRKAGNGLMALLFLTMALPLAGPALCAPQEFRVPVHYYTLPNGLRVVLS